MTPAHHLTAVRDLPCSACGRLPVVAHHPRSGSMSEIGIHTGTAQKCSDYLAIPLCDTHHTGACGIHKIGVRTWERIFGRQVEHIHKTGAALGVKPFLLAENEVKRKHYKKPEKINARRA